MQRGWQFLSDVTQRALSLIYPEVCEVCGRPLLRGEELMCLHCWRGLPRTRCYESEFNIVHERLASTTPIFRAAGLFYYYKNSGYASLIHQAKYSHRPVVAQKLASRFAREIKASGFFDGINVILPVPLHRVKLIKRGYNQSRYIAAGISKETGIEVADNLVATRGHSTQTVKGSFQRWINAQGIYDVENPDELEGKHVLVVDDVITSGATMLACCEALHEACPSVCISVLALAVTHLD